MIKGLELGMYLRALPLYARNLGVLAAPLIATLIAMGLSYFGGWFFAPLAGMGMGLMSIIDALLYGFAFGIAVIFADDAWRHGHANLSNAWSEARRKAGNILIAVIGFYFLIWIARLIGGMLGGLIGQSDIVALALLALAVWAFIYAIPAAAIGGTPGGAALSASLQAAKRSPLATAILVIVIAIVWLALTNYAVQWLPFNEIADQLAIALLTAVAFGYIALIVARQYSDLAFRPFW